VTMRRSRAKVRRIPDWKDWLVDSESCASSLSFFEGHHAIMTLDREIAEDNLRGHLKKTYHNLDLANRLFEMHIRGEFRFRYGGENFYDWVVTVCYYAMYQAALAALAAVRKTSENHAATICALIHYYLHKKGKLGEKYIISLQLMGSIGKQDVQKLIDVREQRERASYSTSYSTELALAQNALTHARDFVFEVRRILEEGLPKDFLKEI